MWTRGWTALNFNEKRGWLSSHGFTQSKLFCFRDGMLGCRDAWVLGCLGAGMLGCLGCLAAWALLSYFGACLLMFLDVICYDVDVGLGSRSDEKCQGKSCTNTWHGRQVDGRWDECGMMGGGHLLILRRRCCCCCFCCCRCRGQHRNCILKNVAYHK